MDFSSVHLLPVLIAALAAFFVGFLWHGPLFGKQWTRLMGIPQSEVDAMQAKGMGPMIPRMIVAFLQQIILALVVTYLTQALPITHTLQAVMFAGLVWLGFIVTTLLNTVLWEKRSFTLYLFNITYHFVTIFVITMIVVLWR